MRIESRKGSTLLGVVAVGTIRQSPTCREVAMSASLDELKTTLSSLPVSDRAELAQYLLQTLDPVEEGAPAEWLALAEQRMAEVRAGKVVGIPAQQVLESLRRPRP